MSAHRVGFRASWVAISSLAIAVAACAGPLHEGELEGGRTVPGNATVGAQRAVPGEFGRGQGALPADCEVRLIVGLSQVPDKRLIADLARVSAARLELRDTISPGRLYALSLTAEGASSECAAAIERLRQDPRVRSAEVDARRKHDGPQA